MDINKMRNIVILRDLPSNLVDEAFVVLKENQKIKKLEYAEKKEDKFPKNEIANSENNDDIVVKEAEMLISNYINNVECPQNGLENDQANLLKKYKYLKIGSVILGVALLITCSYILCIN